MNRRCILATIACALLPPTMVLAQPPSSPQRPAGPGGFNFGKAGDIQKVADNLYMIAGGGGNTTVYVADKGVVLVDVKVAGQGQAILDQVRKVTDKPILYVINTHAHFDHTGGNAFFSSMATIVAQANCAASLRRGANSPESKEGIPDITYGNRLTLLDGAVELYHFDPAHTNGDTIVYFPKAHAIATGDVFPSKSQPIIDTRNGGNGLDFPIVLNDILKTIPDATIVIPGHSPVATRQDLQEFADFNELFVKEARQAFKAGKTPEEAMAQLKKTIPSKFSEYQLGRGMMTGPGGNFEPIFNELRAQQDK